MRCVDCEKHSFIANTHWCDATKKPKRVSEEDAYKDVPCEYAEEQKGADDESIWYYDTSQGHQL